MKTLFGKFFLRFILISLILILTLGFSLNYFFRDFYFSLKEEEIINNSQAILDKITAELQSDNSSKTEDWLQIIAEQNNAQVWIMNRDGQLISSHPSPPQKSTNIDYDDYKDIFSGDIISRRVNIKDSKRPNLLIGLPVSNTKKSRYGLLVFKSVSGINSAAANVQKILVYSSLIAVFLALIIAYKWSKALTKPFKKMSEVAIELSNGQFGKTIPVDEENEVGKLANSINRMSTTLKTTIDDLVAERNKLKYILTGLKEGVLAINKNREIILINESARRLLDIEDIEIDEGQLDEIINKKEVVDLISRAQLEEEVLLEELHFEINKIDKRILIRCTPIYIEDRLWGVVALFQDISQRWRFEQLQKDFVANVSHELKAPLSSIKGASEILLDKVVVDPEKQEDYLQMIIEETDRLEDLVNNVLRLSELDASIPDFKKTKVDVNKLLISVSKVFKKVIKKDDYNLKTYFSEKKLSVYASEERLKQVLLNLLDNAYKFSPDGGGIIEMGVTREENEIMFWVKDQGIGIPRAEQENIWERFYKVDKAHTPDQKGSGLGLAIVKQIVEESGGRVFVESELNTGSLFGFYLPQD